MLVQRSPVELDGLVENRKAVPVLVGHGGFLWRASDRESGDQRERDELADAHCGLLEDPGRQDRRT